VQGVDLLRGVILFEAWINRSRKETLNPLKYYTLAATMREFLCGNIFYGCRVKSVGLVVSPVRTVLGKPNTHGCRKVTAWVAGIFIQTLCG
jgi:hypothetical protein